MIFWSPGLCGCPEFPCLKVIPKIQKNPEKESAWEHVHYSGDVCSAYIRYSLYKRQDIWFVRVQLWYRIWMIEHVHLAVSSGCSLICQIVIVFFTLDGRPQWLMLHCVQETCEWWIGDIRTSSDPYQHPFHIRTLQWSRLIQQSLIYSIIANTLPFISVANQVQPVNPGWRIIAQSVIVLDIQ